MPAILLAGLALPLFAGDRVFTSNGPYGGRVFSPLDLKDGILVGSDSGLWFLPRNGTTWARRRVSAGAGSGARPMAGPSGSGLLYVWSSGVFRSTDAGITFHRLFKASAGRELVVEDVATSLGRPSELYVLLYSASGRSVARTTDDGRTWNESPVPYSVYTRPDLRVDPTDGDRLFMSAVPGLIRSEDGGASWSLARSGRVDRVHVDRGASGEGSEVLIRADGSWLGSSDHGRSWKAVTLCGATTEIGGRGDRKTVYSFNTQGLCRSTDSGQSWTRLHDDVSLRYLDEGENPANLVGLDETGRLVRSTDGGATFAAVSHAGLAPSGWGVGVCRESDGVALVDASRVDEVEGRVPAMWRTTDRGETWSLVDSGLERQEGVSQIVFRPGCAAAYLRAGLRLYRSTDGGASFVPVPVSLHGTSSRLSVSGARPDDLYDFSPGVAGPPSPPAWLARSTNGGLSWSPLTLPCSDAAAFTAASSPGGFLWLTCGPLSGGKVFRSTDIGATWAELAGGSRFLAPQIVAHETERDTAWAAGPGLWRTSDGGASWACLREPVEKVEVSPSNPQRLYAEEWSGHGLLGSTDGGRTWVGIGPGLTPGSFGVAARPGGVDALFVGTAGGVQVMTGWPDMGDLDLDARVDVFDVLLAAAFIVGNALDLDEPFRARWAVADIDQSGTIDVTDVLLLQGYLVGNVPAIPTASAGRSCS